MPYLRLKPYNAFMSSSFWESNGVACLYVSHRILQDYVGMSMALHTRYPGHSGHRPQSGSPLGRVVDIINQVLARFLPDALPS